MKGELNWVTRQLALLFSIDLRSLAAFRIGLGLLILVDLKVRYASLDAHYTDAGVLSRAALITRFAGVDFWSLHLASGTAWFQSLLFLMAAACAVGLVLGYRTRTCVVLSWLLLVSLQARNKMVSSGADDVMRLCLLWAFFLPLNARCSLDARSVKALQWRSQSVVSVASAGLLLQVAAIYVFSVLFKNHPVWHSEFSAVYYVLELDYFVRPFGVWLRQFRSLVRALTGATYYWEAVGPLLAFVPGLPWLRSWVAFAFMFFHLGLMAALDIGIFPLACMVAWLPFVRGEIWDALGRVVFRRPNVRSSRTNTPVYCGTTVGNVSAAALLVACLLINLVSVHKWPYELPQLMTRVGSVLHIMQGWTMFAPHPAREDGWYVLDATLVNGSHVDVYHGGRRIVWKKPKNMVDDYPDERWKKYMMNLPARRYQAHRPLYAGYVCRTWNKAHRAAQHIKQLDLVFMLEKTMPNYQKSKVQKITTLSFRCRLEEHVVPRKKVELKDDVWRALRGNIRMF